MRTIKHFTCMRFMWSGLLLCGLGGCASDSGEEGSRVMQLQPHFTVDGQPVLGTYFGSGGTLGDLAVVKEAKMNLVISGRRNLLDPDTLEGKFCLENGIKVMYPLTQHIYGKPHLGSAMTAIQDTVPLAPWHRPLPESGVIQIEDERIRYQGYTSTALLNCERGIDGTEPASHHTASILLWPEPLAEEIAEVKDSPNLWGYYVLDDNPGDALSALRAMYRIVKTVDGDDHLVCAGFGGPSVLHNFGPGMCDLVLIYHYPFFKGGYERIYISQDVQWMLTECRRKVSGIPFIGVYQGFWGHTGSTSAESTIWTGEVLTPQQVREQMEDYVREGAEGLIAFTFCGPNRNMVCWNSQEPLRRAIREIHKEILTTGGLRVSPQPDSMAQMRIQPIGFWEHPREVGGLPLVWHVIGPFDDADREGLDAVFPPEREIDLAASYPGKHGMVHWTTQPHVQLLDLIHYKNGYAEPPTLERLRSMNYTVTYATCTVTSPQEQTVQMRVGSDDDCIIWFDGREVWRYEGVRGFLRDDDVVPVTLPAGKTRILAKICNRLGNYAFSLRFTDLSGQPLDGLKFSPTLDDL